MHKLPVNSFVNFVRKPDALREGERPERRWFSTYLMSCFQDDETIVDGFSTVSNSQLPEAGEGAAVGAFVPGVSVGTDSGTGAAASG